MKLGKELKAAKILAESGVKHVQLSSRACLKLIHLAERTEHIEKLPAWLYRREYNMTRIAAWLIDEAKKIAEKRGQINL